MRNARLFLIAACLAALAPAANAQKDYGLKKSSSYRLRGVELIAGELLKAKGDAIGPFVPAWRLRKTPRGTIISLRESGVPNGGWGGWYLNYDHKGKDGRVGLVPAPGPGCYWEWKEEPWSRPARVNVEVEFECTARPLNGPMRGWRLAIKGDKLVLTSETVPEARFIGSAVDLDSGK